MIRTCGWLSARRREGRTFPWKIWKQQNSWIRTGVGAVVREATPMFKVVDEGSEANAHAPGAAGGSLLDEVIRDGARAMLAAALQADVAGYVDAHRGEVDEAGHRLVVRNGYTRSGR
jgi:hypothetical protein